MVCKTCKMAIEENADVCPYCKKEFSAGRKSVMVLSLCALVLLAGVIMLYIMNAMTDVPENLAETDQPHPSIDAVPEKISEQDQPNSEEEPFVVPGPTPTPPGHNGDVNRHEDEVWALIESMAITANDYYDRSHRTRVIISKNGYMYNYPAKNYYTPKNFMRIASMKPEYADEQVLLLYMRPDDVRAYLPENSEFGGHNLTLLCAYEVRDGFAIAWREGRLGIIAREDFQKLLAEYSDEHGSVFRHDNDSPAFAEIIAGIDRFKGNTVAAVDAYDVRYLVSDSKYAFVVLSEKNSPEVLEEFVLILEQGDWRVDFYGFENTFMYQKVLNDQYHDFNTGMLPSYNLYYSAKEIRSNVTPLIDAMRAQGVIGEEEGREVFATGTDKFGYMEFENGKKLLAAYTGEETGWVVHAVNNFLHAELIMSQYDENAPTFILKQ